MELNTSKHSHEEEMSLSTDVFRFLQQDHNLLSQHGKKCFYCEVCAKGFTEENDLHYHKLDHIIDKPLFICDDPIEEPISEKPTLSAANEVCQTPKETFTCEKCQKSFSSISCLKIHQHLLHYEYVPTCNHCGNHFKWKHHLAVHKYADSSEKPPLCNTCSINSREESCASYKCDKETSITKNNENSILDLSYTFKKPDIPTSTKHVCHLCYREFSFKGHLNRHILLVHARKKSLAHKYCQKKHSKQNIINTCDEINTIKPFICNICEKGFTHEGFLNRHLRLHSEGRLFCKICHKAFFDNISFNQHLSVHSEKLFACYLCLKSFSCENDLNNHLQYHFNEKPYPCDFCERRFIRKRCLATHIMRLHSDQRPA